MKYKRIFVLVMDSVGIGYDKNSFMYGDVGANTLKHISDTVDRLNLPTLNSLGLNDLVELKGSYHVNHDKSYTMKLNETSLGKDTLTGHFEMMGLNTTKPFKTFTDTGFPQKLIDELERCTFHKIIGNKAASGTEIIKELGEQQMRENSLIVYTSSDSVLQIAAHEEVTGLDELYRCCQIARDICTKDEWKVGRVIARPFIGHDPASFKRTPRRHDYALNPPEDTVLDVVHDAGYKVKSVGKIYDIFNGCGINEGIKTINNSDGMAKTMDIIKDDDFTGLCFINLVEFDSEYGHRRDVEGYALALETFDNELSTLISLLHDDDLLLITADHGNDPTWMGTDHTREKVPLIIYSPGLKDGKCLPERDSFGDIGATILENFGLEKPAHLLGVSIKEVL